jgi:uncharacterized protein YcfL
MRYLVLLLLLVGCNSEPKYKVGDCIRVVSSSNVADFYIRQIIKNKYIMSPSFINKGVPSYLSTKYVFHFDEIHNDSTAIKIECSEVE